MKTNKLRFKSKLELGTVLYSYVLFFVFDAIEKPETFVIFLILQYVSSVSVYFLVMHLRK